MDRDKESSDREPDAKISDLADFDSEATVSDLKAFDPNATLEQTGHHDLSTTVEQSGLFDPDATIQQADHFDPNATVQEIRSFDGDAAIEVDRNVYNDATIDQTSDFDPNATIATSGDLSIEFGAASGYSSEEGLSILNDSNLGQTINPRALSAAEAKYWADISAEFTPPGGPTVPIPANDRNIGQTRLQLRSQTVATQINDDQESADYRLVRLLGRGGMGNVFVARQGSLDRLIAVKVIRPLDESRRRQLAQQGQLESVEQGRRQQFLTEAVVTGDLDHPNIVPIHDVALTGDSTPFYSMKRVIGTPWSDVINDKLLDENIEILVKVADAIGFAHTRGVVHRDIKPENVMLGDFGVVMVMDWGIALAKENFEKLDSITPATGLGGTPSMMAPEMATGPLEKIGPAADIYLLGATLFMIITGKPPHHAPNVSQCLRAVANNDICEFDPKHQGELMNIALRAMSLNPADRYADTKTFQDAIRNYRSHAESVALVARAENDLHIAVTEKSYTQYTRAQFGFEEAIALWAGNQAARTGLRQTKFAHAEAAYENEDFDLGLSMLDKQNPDHTDLIERLQSALQIRRQRESRFALLKKVAAALLAFILIGGSVAIFVINQARASSDRNAAEADKQAGIAAEQKELAVDKAAEALASEKSAKTAQSKAEVEQSKAEYEAYVSGVGLAKARIDRNEFTEARRLISNLIGQRNSLAIPWELRYLSSLANQSTAAITTGRGVDALAIASQLGKADTVIPAIVQFNDGTLSALTVATTAAQPIVFDTSQSISLFGGEIASCIAISENGTFAAAGTEKGEILVFDPHSLASVAKPSESQFRRFAGHRGRVNAIQMIGDEFLVSSGSDRTVRIWNLNVSSDREVLWHLGPVVDIAVCPSSEGFQIAAAVAEKGLSQVSVWDVRTDGELHADRRGLFAEHSSPLTSVAISPDGKLAASGDADGNVLLWPVAQLRQRDVESLVKNAVDIASQKKTDSAIPTTRNTGDGSHAMVFTRLLSPAVDDEQPGKTLDSAPAHRSVVRSIHFSADGQRLLTSGDDYLINLWQIEPENSSTNPHQDRLLRTFRGHGGAVADAEFLSADGEEVLSVGEDNSIRFWKSGAMSTPVASVNLNAADGFPNFCVELRVHDPVLTHVHDDAISSAMLTANGRGVVTASRDRTAQVLGINPLTLQLKESVAMATEESSAIMVDPPGTPRSTAVSLNEGSEFRAMSMRVNRSLGKLFVGGADAVVRIWDLNRGNELGTIPGTGLNQLLAVSADARVILTGSSLPETRAILWRSDPTTSLSSVSHKLAGHEEAVTAAAITSDAKRALTADRAGRIIVWDVVTGAAVGKPIDVLLGTRINDAAFTPDGESVWIAADDERLSRLDLRTREIVDRLDHAGIVTHVELSEDGLRAVTSSELQKIDATVHHAVLWQLPTSETDAKQQTLRTQSVQSVDRTRAGGRPGIASVAINPAGDRAFVASNPSGDASSRVELYQVDDDFNQAKRELVLGLPARLGDVSAATPVKPDELITLHGNSAYRWNTATRSLDISYRIHGPLSVAAISPDGEIVLTASGSLKAWDAKTGVAIAKLESPHQGTVRSIAFAGESAPREFFTGGDDGLVRRWSFPRQSGVFENLGMLGTAEDKIAADVGTPLSLTTSPGGHSLLATTDRGSVILYDLASGSQQVLFSDPKIGSIFAGCFSPDGRFVAAAGQDQIARVWDLSKQHKISDPPDAVFRGHAEAIRGVAMIGECDVSEPIQSTLRLFTASQDRSVRVWDPHFTSTTTADEKDMPPNQSGSIGQEPLIGRELLELVRHRDGVTAIEFNSDSTLMMTAGRDGNVILWPACDP